MGEESPASIVVQRRIEWSDTDASGNYHNTAAFRLIEVGETALLERLGLLADVYGRLPRAHVEADFVAPLVFRDLVDVHLWVAAVGRSSITYEFEMTRRRGRRARPCGRRVVVGGAREAGALAGRTSPAAALRRAAGARAARDRVKPATVWRKALASWAIPRPILDAAPEPPWTFPVELFASRADASTASRHLTASNRRALE